MSFVCGEGEQDLLFRLVFEVVVFPLDGLHGSQGLDLFLEAGSYQIIFGIPTAPCYATKLNWDKRTKKGGVAHWSSKIILTFICLCGLHPASGCLAGTSGYRVMRSMI